MLPWLNRTVVGNREVSGMSPSLLKRGVTVTRELQLRGALQLQGTVLLRGELQFTRGVTVTRGFTLRGELQLREALQLRGASEWRGTLYSSKGITITRGSPVKREVAVTRMLYWPWLQDKGSPLIRLLFQSKGIPATAHACKFNMEFVEIVWHSYRNITNSGHACLLFREICRRQVIGTQSLSWSCNMYSFLVNYIALYMILHIWVFFRKINLFRIKIIKWRWQLIKSLCKQYNSY